MTKFVGKFNVRTLFLFILLYCLRMKKIILISVSLVWAMSLFAENITREQADAIVLERMSQETLPYIIHAKEGIQSKMNITTMNREELELDYSCWVYYVSYPSANCCLGRYLIVNESNGNLLEVNAKGDTGPEDLAEWREKYNGQSNCDQDVIISAEEYEHAPNDPFTIIDVKIVDDCLKIQFGASGCSANSWVVKLIDLGVVAESLPCQRTLRLSLDNREVCAAAFTKEVSFNIKDLQIQGDNKVLLIISGKSILYEYKSEEIAPLTSTMWASVDHLPMGDLKFNRIYVINTFEELKQHPYFFQDGMAIPDLTTKSIVVNYFNGCVFCDVKSAFSAGNDYNWNIAYYANPTIMCFRAESFIAYTFADKIPDNSTIVLNNKIVNCTNEPMTNGNVLMLKVDYLTDTFEGGYEFTFDNVPNSFTIRREYKSPGDFGYVKFFYYETGDILFHGSIIWDGEGQIHFPENLLSVAEFDAVHSENLVIPKNGFENIMAEFQPNNVDYEPIWGRVQNLVKVREYLKANPEQKVKIFLYTPCVGGGNPEHWDWILFLKK